jgi:hypothetical protein
MPDSQAERFPKAVPVDDNVVDEATVAVRSKSVVGIDHRGHVA